MMILVGLLIFLLAAASDYVETRYVRAVGAGNAELAARASVGMWVIGAVGLVALVEVGLWVIVPEGLGLYVGTRLGMR